MKKILFCACTPAALLFTAQLFPQEKDKPAKIIEGFSSPESVISDGKNFYVSNVGQKLEPTVKDGDGFISQLAPDGKIRKLKFITGLDAPKGMAVLGGKLYVTDVDKVKGFDLQSGKEIFNLDFSKENLFFLNDLCRKDEKTLFVSATDKNMVYEIDLETKSYAPLQLSDSLSSPNGLFYSSAENTLYVACYGDSGSVVKINMKSDAKKPVSVLGLKGMFDGLYVTAGMLAVSDWKTGKVFYISRWNKTEGEQVNEWLNGFKGPADFWYDEIKGMFYVPDMPAGKLYIYRP